MSSSSVCLKYRVFFKESVMADNTAHPPQKSEKLISKIIFAKHIQSSYNEFTLRQFWG